MSPSVESVSLRDSESENSAPLDIAPAPVSTPIPWTATWMLLLAAAAIFNTILIFSTHGTRGFFLPALTAVVCLLAGVFDAWTGRIPNPLTYISFLLGLGLNLAVPALERLHATAAITWLDAAGWEASLWAFLFCAVVPAILLPVIWFIFGRNALHVGDLKLLAAVGVLLGMDNTIAVLLFALTVALLYSLANLALAGRLNTACRMAAHRLLELLYFRRLVTPLPEEAVDGTKMIPMAIPLSLGVIAMAWWHWHNGTPAGGVL
jgi:prepilin signal peptidase PulO-like enzyme (type II secretory pathway)